MFDISHRCFLIVPKMVVLFVINSSANFRLVKLIISDHVVTFSKVRLQ